MNALCLGFLKWGHMKRVCRRLVCKTCNGFHPTSLHSDPVPIETKWNIHPRNTPEATSHHVNLCNMQNVKLSCMHSLIVPVWIHHRKDISKQLLICTLLDEQFDACFVKENLLIGSGVNGPKVKLKLSIVLSEKVIKSQRIRGFVVHGYNKDVEIRLPKSYSRSSIPARKSHPKTWICSDLASSSEYFRDHALRQRRGSWTSDWPQLLLSNYGTGGMPGKGDDPHAKRTALGWGIIGAIRSLRE